MAQLPRTPTPISQPQALALLRELGPKVFPGISEQALLVILAHLWLENGAGRSVLNHNFGNVMADRGWIDRGNLYWRPPWFEDPDHPIHEKMMNNEAPAAFRAFATFREGLISYLKVISKFRPAVMAGDPEQYAQGVWDAAYCRDDNCRPEVLSRSLAQFVRQFGGATSPKKKLEETQQA